KEAADKVLEDVRNAVFEVKSVQTTKKKKSPAPPFITSTLQQEASRRLNFPSAKTMSVVQSLYEGVSVDASGGTGLVTYIRTDSTRISDEAQAAAVAHIKEVYGDKYVPGFKRVYKNKNAAQDAHEAIRPTHIDFTPEKIKSKLTNDQYRLYKLIYDRFIASQMADAVFEVCNVDITAGNSLFKASGSVPVFPGFTKLYEERQDTESEENVKLPPLSEGEKLDLERVTPEQKFTQPPSRYTEASLIKTLTEYGVGRPSTYAQIISVVFTRDYVVREKKLLVPTELGKTVNKYLNGAFPNIVDVSFTAGIEEELDKIAQGEKQWTGVISDFYDGFSKELKNAIEETDRMKVPDEVSDVKCEKCGRLMVYKQGRFGRFLACPGYPECKNTKNITENVGVNCPDCGKPLVYHKSKAGKKYIGCSGYPECKFISWNVPTGEKCPKCGKHLEYAFSKAGRRFVTCSNKECDYKSYGKKKKDET
ncbi:MAG: type I DNA topoisomerase, partial [Clostridia bacterium]|nr:type I DNA topoisomerase [Clostridia bacterium]